MNEWHVVLYMWTQRAEKNCLFVQKLTYTSKKLFGVAESQSILRPIYKIVALKLNSWIYELRSLFLHISYFLYGIFPETAPKKCLHRKVRIKSTLYKECLSTNLHNAPLLLHISTLCSVVERVVPPRRLEIHFACIELARSFWHCEFA